MFQMNCDFRFGFVCEDCQRFAGVKHQYALSTNCYCKECQKSYQLNHDQLVWLMPPHITEAQVLTSKQPIQVTSNNMVATPQYLQIIVANDKLDTGTTVFEMYCNKKPEMWDLITIVIPKIQAEC